MPPQIVSIVLIPPNQLHRRAKILNGEFQARVFDLVARHAVVLVDSDDATTIAWQDSLLSLPIGPIPGKQEPAMCTRGQQGEEICQLPAAVPTAKLGGPGDNSDGFGRLPSLSQICTAQYVVTATIMRANQAVIEPPALGSVEMLYKGAGQDQDEDGGPKGTPPRRSQSNQGLIKTTGTSPLRTPSASLFMRTRSDSTVASSGALAVPEIMCQFRDGVFPVWVSPAQAKTVARMTEKVQEYVADGAEWPRTACILDPVRATVVCEGAAQILEVAGWFLAGQTASAKQMFPVCRIKNKFALSSSELVSVEKQS
jgi:hypothetical protein